LNSVEFLMSVSAGGWHGIPMLTSGGTGPMPGEVVAGRGAHRPGGGVVACVAVAAVALAVLHVDGFGTVDPVGRVISDYVALPGGYALLGVAAVALAVAAGLLAAGLRAARLADPSTPVVLLAAASGGLATAAVFPTNDPGTPAGVVAGVHRLAGLVVLVTLPLAAWLIARRAARTPSWLAAARALGWAAGAVCLLSAAFLLGNVAIVISDSPTFTALGAVQRVLYAMVMVVLLLLARATRSAVVAARSAEGSASGAARSDGQLGGMA
jgi:uncharacterized protein DUF998